MAWPWKDRAAPRHPDGLQQPTRAQRPSIKVRPSSPQLIPAHPERSLRRASTCDHRMTHRSPVPCSTALVTKDCDGDGYREAPGCKPLVFTRSNPPDSKSREQGRDLEAEHGCHRHQGAVLQPEMARPDRDVAHRQAAIPGAGAGSRAAPVAAATRACWCRATSTPSTTCSSRRMPSTTGSTTSPRQRRSGPAHGDLRSPVEHRSRLTRCSTLASTYANDVSHPWLKNYLRHPFWRTPLEIR